MNPSRQQIEEWSEDMGDGWTRIPTSAFTELLWLLGLAEEAEARLTSLKQFPPLSSTSCASQQEQQA